MVKYNEYIKSKEWSKKRLYYLKRWKECYVCRSTKRLELHHLCYKNLGNEKPKDLVFLCHNCHYHLHNIKKGYTPKRKSKVWTQYDTDMYNYYGIIPKINI